MKHKALGLVVLLALWGCPTPSTDPDQAARNLLSGKTWMDDGTVVTNDPVFAYFKSDGTLLVGGAPAGTWSYSNAVLTLTLLDSSQDVTTAPTLTATQFSFRYKGVVRNFSRL